IDFVSPGIRDSDGTGFTYLPDSVDLTAVLGCRRFCFPLLRRAALAAVGGYDGEMPTTDHADWDLVIRLAAHGSRGIVLPGATVNHHSRRRASGTGESPRL